MSAKIAVAIPAILFAIGSALFLVGNLILVARALR